jgi:hypothetical protein
MKKAYVPVVVMILLGLLVTACGTPPPLKSDKYLNDTSLISGTPCAPPCFHGVTVGQTTYTDALSKVKADSSFKDVQEIQNQDKVPSAAWNTAGGEACCQMSADKDTGLINALIVKVAPNMTVKQVIDKYGPPDWVTSVDYTPQEVALGLIFRKVGVMTWVTPGDENSTLKESDPVVIVLYLNPEPKEFDKLLDTATLQGWNGYIAYKAYKAATPIVTPRVTPTAQ